MSPNRRWRAEPVRTPTGRTWDVLWMALNAIRRNRPGSSAAFEVMAVVDRVRPSRVALRIECGPGDDAEPVLTILLPDED